MIYGLQRQSTRRDRHVNKIPQLLGHTQNAHNTQEWVRPEPGAHIAILASQVSGHLLCT